MSPLCHKTQTHYAIYDSNSRHTNEWQQVWPQLIFLNSSDEIENYDIVACIDADSQISLIFPKSKLFKPIDIRLDATRKSLGKDPLLKAIGHKSTQVLDLTAGWGVDAAHLAHHQYHVTALEQHPFLAFLLIETYKRCQSSVFKSSIQFHHVDALSYINENPMGKFDVVYLDPMYPEKKKSAATNKKMQILQLLHLSEKLNPNDVKQLLIAARKVATKRVVVKRPHFAPPIEIDRVGYTQGKLLRFDIYHPDN